MEGWQAGTAAMGLLAGAPLSPMIVVVVVGVPLMVGLMLTGAVVAVVVGPRTWTQAAAATLLGFALFVFVVWGALRYDVSLVEGAMAVAGAALCVVGLFVVHTRAQRVAVSHAASAAEREVAGYSPSRRRSSRFRL